MTDAGATHDNFTNRTWRRRTMRKQSINFFKKIFMTVRKNARPAGFVLLLAIAWTAVSCEMNTTVDAEHEPVLQIDAVFYSDERSEERRVGKECRCRR